MEPYLYENEKERGGHVNRSVSSDPHSSNVMETTKKEAFINEGRGYSPTHLKFFLLVFSKFKEDIK